MLNKILYHTEVIIVALETLSNAGAYQMPKAQPVKLAETSLPESTDGAVKEQVVYIKGHLGTAWDGEGQKINGQYQEERNQQKTNEQLKKAVDEFNKKMFNSEAVYGVHEGTNRVMIKIVDRETKKVIKEIPPEKSLDMLERAWEIAGILMDEER